jgi:MFS family permease
MKPRARLNNGYIVVAASTLIILVGFGTYYSYSVFFDPLLNEFGWTRAQTAGAFSIATLVSGSLGILAGRISDRIGPKIVCILGGLFLGLGYILMSLVNTTWQVYLIYGMLLAIGISGFWPAAVSTVARWFRTQRGLMTGIVTTGNGVGTLVFSLLLSHLIMAYTWRWAYIITGIITTTVIVSAAFFLKSKNWPENASPGKTATSPEVINSADKDFTFKQALKTKSFWLLFFIFFLFGYVQFSMMVHVVPYATGVNISPLAAAGVLAFIGGSSIVGRLVTGVLIDKVHVKPLFLASLVLLLASLIFIEFSRNLWSLYLVGLLFGLAYGGNSTSLSLVAADLFGLTSLGTLVGTFVFCVCFGGSLGPVITGLLFDVSGNYQLAFGCCILAAVITLILNFSLIYDEKSGSKTLQSSKKV